MIAARLRPLFCSLILVAAAAAAPTAHAQSKSDGVRPEVGKPLQAAQALVKQRKGREALAEVAKAEAVPNRTAAENQVIQQMKGSAALAAGDNDAVIKAYEPMLEGRGGSPQMVQAVAVA